MEYTIVLTQQPNLWRATIVGLPDGVVEAPTRSKALEAIQSLAADLFSRSEVIRLELTTPSLSSLRGESEMPQTLAGFGAFKDDPTLSPLFDQIEQQRDEHWLGE